MTPTSTALMVVALVGCSDRARSTTSHAAPADAAPDPDVRDANVEGGVAATPRLECSAQMRVKGKLEVTIDPSTLRGEIVFFTAGPALTRHLKVLARPVDDTTTLVFDGYFPDDHQTIRRVRAPRPKSERLVVGKSIVGRIVTVGGEDRFDVDGEVDWVTGTSLDIHDGHAPCRR